MLQCKHMSWASNRKLKYVLGLILVLAFIVFLFFIPTIFRKPTCTDGKQNGTETGIDCGGICPLLCKQDVADPVVVWSRAFPVIGNNYNLVAFVENRNINSGVINAPYEFRIYDTNNKLLGRREGVTFIPPNQQFAVFEARFDSGQNQIKTVTFDFIEPLVWIKKVSALQTLPIHVTNIVFDDNKDTPNLQAVMRNDSIYDIPGFDVVAILYDQNHNAINASKTHKNGISSNSTIPLIFTWPETLSAPVFTKDIIPLINPFSVSF